MNESEVKERLFQDFCDWMRHQTVGMGMDGHAIYYTHDVDRYCWLVRRRVVVPHLGVDD